MKKRIFSTLSLLLCTGIWGVAFVAQDVGMDHIGPYTFQAIRCLLAVIGLLPIILISDLFKKDGMTFFSRWLDPMLWKAGLACGIPLFLAVTLQQIGIDENDQSGKSAFLTAMYIVFVPIIGILFRKKPSIWVLFGVISAVAGLYYLCFSGVNNFRFGDLLLLGCAVMFAVQITFVDKLGSNADPLRLNLIQAAICSALSAILMLFFEQPTMESITACWLPLAYAGFLSMGVAYSLQIIGQKELPPTAAAVIMSLESIFAVIAGNIMIHENLSLEEYIGCALMFIGVILSQIPEKKRAA